MVERDTKYGIRHVFLCLFLCSYENIYLILEVTKQAVPFLLYRRWKANGELGSIKREMARLVIDIKIAVIFKSVYILLTSITQKRDILECYIGKQSYS